MTITFRLDFGLWVATIDIDGYIFEREGFSFVDLAHEVANEFALEG